MNPSVFCLKAEKNTFRETKQINQPPVGLSDAAGGLLLFCPAEPQASFYLGRGLRLFM